MFIENLIEENGVAESRAEAIDTLCRRLYSDGKISDLSAFRAAVLQRESEMSTELAPAVFAPHAKSKTVITPSVAMMKTKNNERVFLIASDSDASHLKALSVLSQALLEES